MDINDTDFNETARLVLMDIEGKPSPNGSYFGPFVQGMRTNGYPHLGLIELKDIFSRYMGFDGRAMPTHAISTGKRIKYA